MTGAARLSALAVALLLTGAAKGDESVWMFLGVVVALGLVLSLPAALLLHGWKPEWIATTADAYGRRKTAASLIGAGLGLGLLVVISALGSGGAAPLAVMLLVAACAYFVIGLAGCARRQGLRLLSLDADSPDEPSPGEPSAGDARRLKPLVIGWLARSGVFAVPLLWPFLGAYVIATSLGAPIVAWLESRRGDDTVD